MKLIRVECGCAFQYNPETFVGGERVFECAHKKKWKVSAIRDDRVVYEVSEVS